jgi:hypothetical protein
MGQPLTMSDLNLQIRRIPGVTNFIPDQQDIYPGGQFFKLTLNPSQAVFR